MQRQFRSTTLRIFEIFFYLIMWVYPISLPAYEFAQVTPVAKASDAPKKELLLSIVGAKVGHFEFNPEVPLEVESIAFNFAPASVDTISQGNATMLNAVCKHFNAPHGPNRQTAALQISKIMQGEVVKKKSSGFVSKGKTQLLQEAVELGVTHGVKVSGKQAGKKVPLGDLNMAELVSEIEQKKFAAAATAAAAAAVKDDSEEEDAEDEEEEELEEEGAEEEAQDDVDEVIYLAHL